MFPITGKHGPGSALDDFDAILSVMKMTMMLFQILLLRDWDQILRLVITALMQKPSSKESIVDLMETLISRQVSFRRNKYAKVFAKHRLAGDVFYPMKRKQISHESLSMILKHDGIYCPVLLSVLRSRS